MDQKTCEDASCCAHSIAQEELGLVGGQISKAAYCGEACIDKHQNLCGSGVLQFQSAGFDASIYGLGTAVDLAHRDNVDHHDDSGD